MKDGDVAMLEDIRLHKKEERNDDNFAKELSELGDIYVNEAFSVSHRKHASIVGIPKVSSLHMPVSFLKKRSRGCNRLFAGTSVFTSLGGVKAEAKLGVIDGF